MTKSDRNDLISITRQREKLAKSDADSRASELRAEFEQQISAEYSYDQNATWKEAYQRAEAVVKQAQQQIEAEASKLGIPRQFAPRLQMAWYDRGENAVKERRNELRRAAEARITAMTKEAKRRIEAASVEIRERLLTSTLASDDARAFFESMPKAVDLMPLLTIEDVRRDAGYKTPLLQ